VHGKELKTCLIIIPPKEWPRKMRGLSGLELESCHSIRKGKEIRSSLSYTCIISDIINGASKVDSKIVDGLE
jgi:hypothetical protein